MRFPLDKQEVGGYDYGMLTSYTKNHLGVDWRARYVQLRAPTDGYIVSVTIGKAGGKTLVFRPTGKKTLIRWLHLNEFRVAHEQLVKEGDLLAITGNSGASEAPHLHEDIWPGGAITLKYTDTMNPHDFYKG